ncbi:MAG: hypothetical protein GC159_22970 [Phycisphaera sp.]|nr:hypothetical protein [Phycisphaera sp.]
MPLFDSPRTACAVVFITALTAAFALAHEPGHVCDDPACTKCCGLHFSHPMFTESPSPDTKVRLDYLYQGFAHDEGQAHTLGAELEWAPARWFSVELGVPYTWLDPKEEKNTNHLDTVDLGLKFACYEFEDLGVLVGGGIEFGFPTGNDDKGIGSDHTLEVEPFIDAAYKHGDFEFVSFVSFGIPTNQNPEDGELPEADWELGWNLSAMYHVTHNLAGLIELYGQHVFGGEEDGHNEVRIAPGVKVGLADGLDVGVGVSLPLTTDRETDVQVLFSVFYHF